MPIDSAVARLHDLIDRKNAEIERLRKGIMRAHEEVFSSPYGHEATMNELLALAENGSVKPSQPGDVESDMYQCPRCQGQGDILVGNQWETCPICNGKGEVNGRTAADNGAAL